MTPGLRQFWWLHREKLQLAGPLTLVAIIGLIVVSLTIARGPAVKSQGRIAGFRAVESEAGAHTRAQVRVDGRLVVVRLGPAETCAVGDQIALWKRPTLVGDRYAAASGGCAVGATGH